MSGCSKRHPPKMYAGVCIEQVDTDQRRSQNVHIRTHASRYGSGVAFGSLTSAGIICSKRRTINPLQRLLNDHSVDRIACVRACTHCELVLNLSIEQANAVYSCMIPSRNAVRVLLSFRSAISTGRNFVHTTERSFQRSTSSPVSLLGTKQASKPSIQNAARSFASSADQAERKGAVQSA